jgi:fido (protein-threonine AMPylation protein)
MSLTERQLKIFEAFLETPEDARSVADFTNFGLERTTLFRDLRKLVQEGLLRPEGKSYRVNQESDAFVRWDLARPPHRRREARYDPTLLGSYTPNASFLLTEAQLQELGRIGIVPSALEARETNKQYERVLRSLLVDLTHASSNLENVNISWLDTKTLIEFGERPAGLTENQLRIVTNHKDAIAFLSERRESLSLSRRDLLDLHSLLVNGLLGDAAAVGNLRSVVVRFDDSTYLPPDNPHQLREAFEEFCEKAQAIENPHEQAFFTMAFIPYLQPFQDGNKRTSRLGMNIPLLKAALAPFSFADIRRRDYMFGLLAFYERGRHQFLAQAFVEAYTKSAARYAELISHINAGGLLGTVAN